MFFGFFAASLPGAATRRGLPTFFCCPEVHSTPSIVHRVHFGSLGCWRRQLDLYLLQSSHDSRLCDGWMGATIVFCDECTE